MCICLQTLVPIAIAIILLIVGQYQVFLTFPILRTSLAS